MRLLGTHNLLAWPLAGGLLALLLIVRFIHAQGTLLSLRSGPLGEILIGVAVKTADALGDETSGRCLSMARLRAWFFALWTGPLPARIKPLSRSIL